MRKVVVLVALFLAALAMAQDYRGSLEGTVTDASGAVVPGVAVVVQNESTNAVFKTETNSVGNYLAPLLEPGDYTVTAEAAGFKKLMKKSVAVRTGEKLTFNIRMEVGTTSESVEVTADVPLVETASANMAQIVDRRFLDSLYLSNRSPLAMLSLTPGVEGGGKKFTDSTQQEFTIQGGGGVKGNNEITLDGASVVVPRQGGTIAASPSGDAVEEMRIQSTMFDAAYGHSNGGVVAFASRGGTNTPHGSFEGFYRNSAMNANTWLNNKRGLGKSDDNRQFYSGTFGGPVWIPGLYNGKNRTFFFVSAQYDKTRGGSTYSGRTFTDLERNGDFSQTLNGQGTKLTIYDPYSTVVNGSTATRQPFAGNVIPAASMEKAGKTMAGRYPLANISGQAQIGAYNWISQGSSDEPAKQISARVDQVINSNNRLFARVNYINYDRRYSKIPSGMLRSPVGGEPNDDLRNMYSGSMNTDHVITPTLIASMRYVFNRYDSRTVFRNSYVSLSSLGLPDIISQNAALQAFPRLDLGSNTITMGNRLKARANDSHGFNPGASKLTGAHSTRFGADIRIVNWNEVSPDYSGAGQFTFSDRFTRSDPFKSDTGKTTGASLASLLLGTPDSGTLGGATPYSLRSYYYAFFVQDQWKISKTVTLSYGLRYEIETPYTERYNRLAYGFDYTSPSPVTVPGMDLRGGLLFAGVNKASRYEGRVDTNNFAPNIGIAWEIRPGTVFRAGYGLFYASSIGNMDTGFRIPPTFDLNAPYVGTTDSGATPYTNLSNPYPNGIQAPSGNKDGLAARYGSSLSFVTQNRVLPYAQQWQAGFQQSLPSKIRLELAFVRMLSVKGIESFNLNEKPDKYLALGSAENTQVANPFYGILPSSTSLGSSKKTAQKNLWTAYPQFSSLNQGGSNTHVASYHSVQLNLEKRLSHGLSVLSSLTLSKLMENNTTSLVNERHYRSVGDLDRPYTFTLATVYDLPFGTGRAFLNGKGIGPRLLGNWTISARTVFRGGNPMSISDSNGRPIRLRNAAKSGSVSDRLGDKTDPVTGKVLNPYFDTTAFQSLPSQYTIAPDPPTLPELRTP
ncbi:MAG TPA: TonB-dependent receptor, partial [Candidatus Acidoferrum sp.]